MKDDLDKELAKLADRSDALAEDQKLPRGAQPALFRAARVSDDPAPVLEALVPRLADLPLVSPTLDLVSDLALAADYVRGLTDAADRRAWCSLRQAAALAEDAPSPEWVVRALRLLLADEPEDPTELALAREPGPFAERLREVIRLRLASAASKRCRTSSSLARGALAALAKVAPDTDDVHQAARRILVAEVRRAGRGEPVLALAALDALTASPPLAQVRVLYPLVDDLARRKVQTRAREVLAAATEAAGCTVAEVTDLCARDGGAEPDGWVRVPLEEGGETRVRLDGAGGVLRDGPADCAGDRRAVENAERRLKTDWDELADRLERALTAGRDWRTGLWREVFVSRHPLWEDLAGRVVWELRQDGERTPFVWERADAGPDDADDAASDGAKHDADGQARDLFGDPVDLPAGAAVGLWHPALADADELELWRERALTRAAEGLPRAPFPQAFREVQAPEPDDPLGRYRGREAHKAAVEAMGWKGVPLFGSAPWEIEREVGELYVRIELDEVKIAFKPTLQQRKAAHRRARDGEKPKVRQHKEAKPRVRLTAIELEGDPTDPDVCRALAEAIRDLETLTDPLATVDDLFLRTWQGRKWKDPAEAWKEVVLRYRKGSPASLDVRRTLIEWFAKAEGITPRLEDRFAIVGNHVVELGTGLVHEGPPKDHLPQWKADELAAAAREGRPPLAFPFRRDAAPETVAIVERVLGLACLDAE